MIKKTLCFSNPAYLSLKDRQLLVDLGKTSEPKGRYPVFNESIKSIPIEDIGVVVLENRQITITNAALDALLENNCVVIVCDNTHMPSGLLMPLCSNTIQQERFVNQINASLPLRKQLWQQTIQQKIRNQAAILHTQGITMNNMLVWAQKVRSGDPDNLEARAAAYYWRNIFPTIPEFVRNRDEVPPNNLLNYGYAILRAVIARSLVGSGLLPTLGIHHHNRYNAYCLADDIMEPYRPYVDQLVVDVVAKYQGDIYVLTPEIKKYLLSIPVLDVNINGQRSPLMIAATTTTASLTKCYNGELRKIIYPEIRCQ